MSEKKKKKWINLAEKVHFIRSQPSVRSRTAWHGCKMLTRVERISSWKIPEEDELFLLCFCFAGGYLSNNWPDDKEFCPQRAGDWWLRSLVVNTDVSPAEANKLGAEFDGFFLSCAVYEGKKLTNKFIALNDLIVIFSEDEAD